MISSNFRYLTSIWALNFLAGIVILIGSMQKQTPPL